MKKKGRIELSVAGKHPTIVFLGLLDLKIPEQIASFSVARFQRSVQHTHENDIASDCGGRKHVRFSLLTHDGLATVCVNNVVQTGVRCGKEHFPISNRWRCNDPAQLVEKSPFL